MRTKPALISGAMVLLLIMLMAQPVTVVRRLRDLTDVKHQVPPSNGDTLVWNTTLNLWTNGVGAGAGTVDGLGSANTLPIWTDTNTLGFIANAIGILTNDGAGAIGYTTNLAQAVTYQNVTYNVSRGGQLTITTNLIIQTNAIVTLSNLPSPSVLVLATNQQVTNATLSGLTLSDANVLTATGGGGDTTGTNIVTLTQTGTNVSAMDFSLVQNGGVFKLSLTNNAFIPTPSNVGNTAFRKAWLMVQQPSTGTCLVSWTNATFAGPEGQTLVNDTNNGAVVIYEMVSDVFTNGLVHVFMSQRSKLMP